MGMFLIYFFSRRVLNNCLTIVSSWSVELISSIRLFCCLNGWLCKVGLEATRCRNYAKIYFHLFLDLGFPLLLVAVADSTVEVDDRLLDPFKSFQIERALVDSVGQRDA